MMHRTVVQYGTPSHTGRIIEKGALGLEIRGTVIAALSLTACAVPRLENSRVEVSRSNPRRRARTLTHPIADQGS
jgi:hypothetical protein